MLSLLLRALYHHLHTVLHHHIHHHIEHGGGDQISLCHSTSSLKRHPVIDARLCHHFQLPPIRPEEPKGLGAHAVTFQDMKAPGPVQGVIRLVQVQEDHLQDLLPQGR